jgi:hypothetical protein
MQYVDTANNQQENMYGGFGFSQLFDLSVKKLYVTSTDSIQSVSFSANFNNVTLRKSLMFGNDDVHITFNVVLKNIGQTEIRDFYCKRNLFGYS